MWMDPKRLYIINLPHLNGWKRALNFVNGLHMIQFNVDDVKMERKVAGRDGNYQRQFSRSSQSKKWSPNCGSQQVTFVLWVTWWPWRWPHRWPWRAQGKMWMSRGQVSRQKSPSGRFITISCRHTSFAHAISIRSWKVKQTSDISHLYNTLL